MKELQLINNVDNLRYRVICYSEPPEPLYFLQRKTFLGWQTMCGYHRGTTGYYSYEYDECYNPFAQVEHNLYDVLQEELSPTIPKIRRFMWYLGKPPRLKGQYITAVYRPNDLVEAINVHRRCGYIMTTPYPPLSVVISYER